MTITNKFGTRNMNAKRNRDIKYIVIHYTAGVTSKPGTAVNTALWFDSGQASASSDFIVDDMTIVQYNADIKNRYTWHCGGNKYSTKGGSLYGKCTNANSIGIEICSTNSTGKMQAANDKTYSFTAAAVANAAALVKQLMKEYNIPPENVVRHYDVTGKPCPGIIGWNADSGSEAAWNEFKKSIVAVNGTVMHYLQVGAFATKKLAENFLADVKKDYPESFIKYDKNLYYVQVGAFASKTNAEKYLAEVRKKYPGAFIKNN